MSASTSPACKAAILEILGTVTDLATVDLRWAQPTEDEDVSDEMVYLGGVEITDDNWASLGNGRRRENYRVDITTWVRQWGDDPQTVEERSWAIWGLIEAALVADLSRANAPNSQLRAAGVRQFGQITATQQAGPAAPQQWGSRIDARIAFTADITTS